MKKSTFVATLLGTISSLFFALGMCMALLHEWNAFRPGVIIGALLLGVGMCLIMVWSNMVIGIVVGIVGIAVL